MRIGTAQTLWPRPRTAKPGEATDQPADWTRLSQPVLRAMCMPVDSRYCTDHFTARSLISTLDQDRYPPQLPVEFIEETAIQLAEIFLTSRDSGFSIT